MTNNNKVYSIAVKNFKFENEENSQFLKTKFYGIAEGDNLNQSAFTFDSIKECLSTEDYANKPILGSWKIEKATPYGVGDFGGHDSELEYDTLSGELYNTYLGENKERPLGLIYPNTAKIELYKEKQWLTFEGAIWAKYNREAVNLLKKKRINNVSVEIEVLESYKDERDYDIITKFTLLGITIIGVEAGIPHACLNVLDFCKTPQYNNFVMAFSKANNNSSKETIMEFLKKEKFGSGNALKLDLTKESASSDNWGSLSRTKQRDEFLLDKNYKKNIPKEYLVVEEGWEDSPSNKLKYPIAQVKDGNIVLNINGVQSASSMLMREKDKPYFKEAKAKLNKIRKILDMEKLFGIEWNDDFGTLVALNQPKTIKMEDNTQKMEKKEIKAKLSALFEEVEKLEKDKKELSSKYEEKLGNYSYAEDDKKEEVRKEMESAETDMRQCEKEVDEKKMSIMDMTKELMKMSDDEDEDDGEDEKIDDEEEEEPIDTVGDKYEQAVLKKDGKFVCKSKSYILYVKDSELKCAKFSEKDDKVEMAEEIKMEKAYATFITGGSLDKNDMSKFPKVNVEFSKSIEKAYANIKEMEDKLIKCEKEKEDFKAKVEEYSTKLEEMASEEKMPLDFKKEIMNKIFKQEFSDIKAMETEIMAKLYALSKTQNGGLSGSFPTFKKNVGTTEISEKEKIESFINEKYNSKKK